MYGKVQPMLLPPPGLEVYAWTRRGTWSTEWWGGNKVLQSPFHEDDLPLLGHRSGRGPEALTTLG